ncbi:ABC transporter ATP-binding protein [Natrononativus amylolyticus]|uniref:ABC transporter ATP-binding protein n=1 Tax=Natrononativus amylolyticus TaxID=2963434 RepID=UPI0020CF90C4|nr:ABC transporter ATP-binding protein [Natrononativus amylolyticus]
MSDAPAVRVEEVNVSYGDLQVLWDVSMELTEDDRVVALIGPNGAGKTTLLKTLSGLLAVDSGRIDLFGRDATALSPDRIVDLGFVHVPEERNLFTEMTVVENLEMGAFRHRDEFEATLGEVFELFPILEERHDQHAGTLSGGEQQMLAIGRGLMAQPTVLALDELSVGLAPKLVARVFEKVEEISEETTVLLTEQHVHEALGLADRAYLLENGRITLEDSADALLESDRVTEAYLRD